MTALVSTSQKSEIFAMKDDVSEAERLTENSYDDFAPSISSDGKRLYYISDRNGIFNIYSMDIAAGKITQHTDVTGGSLQVNISKDKGVVFSSYRHGKFDIYKMQ